MTDLYETMRIASEAAKQLQMPSGMIAAMRVIEEQERATRWLRETESAGYLSRLHEETEGLRRIQEMTAGLNLDKLGLYGAGIEATHRLLGSSMGIAGALEREAERQRREYLEPTTAIHRAAMEQMRQVEQFSAHARSIQTIAESTYRLNELLQTAVVGSSALDAARSVAQALMPYNALERACSGVLDTLAATAPTFSGYSSILTFAPIVLPNVAATVILASLSPSDLSQDEIEASLESLSELIDVDGPTLALQLRAIHPKLVPCLQTARDATGFNTPERLSIVCGQLRRTIEFTLDSLAPEADVREWISNPTLQANEFGRPSRLARLTYVFRNLYCAPSLARMVFADCVVFNRLYSQLSLQCHTGMADYDEVLAQLLITRVEALLYLFSCAHIGKLGGASDDD